MEDGDTTDGDDDPHSVTTADSTTDRDSELGSPMMPTSTTGHLDDLHASMVSQSSPLPVRAASTPDRHSGMSRLDRDPCTPVRPIPGCLTPVRHIPHTPGRDPGTPSRSTREPLTPTAGSLAATPHSAVSSTMVLAT